VPVLRELTQLLGASGVAGNIPLGQYWSSRFNAGHFRDFDQRGLPIRGWTIVDRDGVIATKTIRSNCGGLYQSETTSLVLRRSTND